MIDAAVSVRRARPEDGERVAAMVRALALGEGRSVIRMTAEAFRRFGFGPRARFSSVVVEAAGTVEGYAIFMPVFSVAEVVPGFFIDDLYVEPPWRQLGLGQRLMQGVAHECLRRGGSYVMWNVRLGNPGAVAFYDRIGAVKTDHNCRWIEGDALNRLAGAGSSC
jgi:GNAT superfamily N-acetyltransferase